MPGRKGGRLSRRDQFKETVVCAGRNPLIPRSAYLYASSTQAELPGIGSRPKHKAVMRPEASLDFVRNLDCLISTVQQNTPPLILFHT